MSSEKGKLCNCSQQLQWLWNLANLNLFSMENMRKYHVLTCTYNTYVSPKETTDSAAVLIVNTFVSCRFVKNTLTFKISLSLISDSFWVTWWCDLSVELFQCTLFVKTWSIWDAADGYKITVMSWDKEKYRNQKFCYTQYNTIYIMGMYGWERLVLTFYTL